MFAPSRWKMSCGRIATWTYRSPAGALAAPASPSPASRMRTPSSIARGDGDRQRPVPRHGARPAAHAARVAHHAAHAAAGRAGALDQEEALLRAHLAVAAAGRAGVALRLLVGRAGAGAGVTRDAARHAQVDLGAGEGIDQVDLDLCAQVRAGAACGCRRARRPPMNSPNIWSKMSPRPPSWLNPAAAAAVLERRVAVAVVGGALLVVTQDLVGLADFLELRLGGLVARVAVRVVLHRLLAVCPLQVVGRGLARAFQQRVVILLCQFSSPSGKRAEGRHPRPGRGPEAPDPVHDSPQADFLCSSTSSNSASTTFSPALPAAAGGSAAGASDCAL